MTCHVRALGHPLGADPEHFHLIAPYEAKPDHWTKMEWIDQYSGNTYRITTAGAHGTRRAARVKTYADVLQEYEWHPESKCADAKGAPCGKQTIGLLQRRHVQVDGVTYIGKESNSLDDVDAGLIHAAEAVYTRYPDPRRDTWRRVVELLPQVSLEAFERRTGKSRRLLIDAKRGRRSPSQRTKRLLEDLVRALGLLKERC